MQRARLFASLAAAWLPWASVAQAQEKDVQEVRVRAAPRAPRDPVTATVSADEARHVAGTQGDVAKVVDNLPGVARPPLGSGQLVVWGSAPSDTRTYIDGVEVPSLYHGSGLRSVINSDLVASVALLPGGFGADYGRTLGGTVRVETRALRDEGVHGYAGADTYDASAFVSAALGSKVRAGVAARYSYLDALLAATSARDIGDYFPIPRYRDYQARIAIDLAQGESLDVTLLGSHDALDRTVASADPAKTRTERTEGGFHRVYARWKRTTREAEGIEVTPFVGYDQTELTTSFGGNPTKLDVGSMRYGMRASYRVRFGRKVVASTGIDASGTASQIVRRGSLTLPPREGDIAVFGAPPSDDTTADDFSTHVLDVAPHLSLDVKLGDLTVTPGVRVETFLIEGERLLPTFGQKPDVGFSRVETAIDPRLLVRYQPMPRLTFFASGGAYHQAPEPADLSAIFGTPALGLSRALHASLGERITVLPGLTAEVTGFYKTMSDLVVRSRSVTPKLAQALVQDGEGRSYGLQLLVRRELGHGLSGWISYTMSRSERRIAEPAARYRLFDFDQPHVLVVALSQELGRWVLGARFRYASGVPRTPVVGAYYDAVSDRSDPVFGLHNGARLPAFYQLDARVERSVPLGKDVLLALSLDVQNVTYRENAEEVVYSPDFRQRGYIRGLPTVAVVGARLEF
ncbi:TonB-dependent receptor [Pendulispora albinea]|uniref:TonB-dependent receptor n=1 Tax=Pendulispora albinea TaxID=2741071 RepID=A0ABZ2LPT1_9BACT